MLVLNQPPLPIGIQGQNSSWLFCYAGTTKKTSIDLSPLGVGSKTGADDGGRTHDIHVGNVMHYHCATSAKLERGTRIKLVSSAWKAEAQSIYQPRNLVGAAGVEPASFTTRDLIYSQEAHTP